MVGEFADMPGPPVNGPPEPYESDGWRPCNYARDDEYVTDWDDDEEDDDA